MGSSTVRAAAARDVGFPFIGKSKDTIEIEVLGQPERYTHLKTLEFSSARKRMSIIVRASDGHIVLYCKGADSVIYKCLAANGDKGLKEKTSKDMDFFANGGLRTLCMAYRVLRGHTNTIRSLCMSRDECHLVNASEDCSVRIWNLKVEAALKQDGDGVHARAYNAVISSSISLPMLVTSNSNGCRYLILNLVACASHIKFHWFTTSGYGTLVYFIAL